MRKVYHDMTKGEISKVVCEIVSDSLSDDEIARRLSRELSDSCVPVVTSHMPTDQIGREARAIVWGLGGLIRKDGAMVMVMMYGPSGDVILF